MLGASLVGIGVAGIFLPIVPGILLIVVGAALLGGERWRGGRFLERLRRK